MTYTQKELLGRGDEGSVYRVVKDGREYASKVYHVPIQQLELEVLTNANHPNIIRSYQITPFVVMDLGKPLTQYIQRPYSLEKLCFELLCGLEFLHTHGVDHNDLHLYNIVMVAGVAKICDFGRCSTVLPYNVVKRDIEYFGFLLYNLIFHNGRESGDRVSRVQHLRFTQQ
jgi:serine/threonine protein kinase